ncbi:MAG: retention module-containing protein, partial [Azoarcus sp.]|nr:retention module-containing protein [Azoarcus sp.]
MRPDQVVASVNSVEGQAFARGPDGDVRSLMPGDSLHNGEILVADPSSHVEVVPGDGSPSYFIDGPLQLAMAENIPTDEAEMDPETIAEIIERFQRGEELPPPEAGGGGGSRPHSFVMLERIVEPVDPAANEFGTAVFRGEGPFQWLDLSASGGGGGGGGGGEQLTPQPDEYTVVEGSDTFPGNVLDNDPAGSVVAKVIWLGVEYDVPAEGFKFTTALNGTVTILPDGRFLYSAPVSDHSSGVDPIDHFYYIGKDADGNLSDPVKVEITITDTVPTAVDDNYNIPVENAAYRFTANVLDNDKFSKDDTDLVKPGLQNMVGALRADAGSPEVALGSYNPVTATLTTADGHKWWFKPDGTFEFVPKPGFTGTTSIQYKLVDADGSFSWATVTVNVPEPPQKPPVVVDDQYTVVEGSDTFPGNVLDNDAS